MHPALKVLLTETVQVAQVTGYDSYGAPQYGTGASYPACVQRRMVTNFTPVGRQIIVETRIYLNGDVPLTEVSQITLPSGATATMEGLEIHLDEQGDVDHFEIRL